MNIVSGLASSNETGITQLIVVEKVGPGETDEDYTSHVLRPTDPEYPEIARAFAELCVDRVLAQEVLDAIPAEGSK